VKIKRRWRDYGTGLESGSGRDLSSLYAINWDRVQEYDWARAGKMVSKRRTA
jgi:hypothetical protein